MKLLLSTILFFSVSSAVMAGQISTEDCTRISSNDAIRGTNSKAINFDVEESKEKTSPAGEAIGKIRN